MSLPGGHNRCSLQKVLNAQEWSELCRVQKHGGHGDALSTMRVQDTSALCSRGLLSRATEPQAKRESWGGLAIVTPVQ